MTGQWPPEWGEEDETEQQDQFDEQADPRLSEVSAFLASMPAPVLPDAVEARISAAIGAEAASRGSSSSATAGAVRSRKLGPAPARARVRRGRGFRAAVATGPLVLLLLAGLGFFLARGGTPPSYKSAESAPSAAAGQAGARSMSPYSSAVTAAASASASALSAPFLVTESGTKYQQETLVVQVRAVLAQVQKVPSSTVPSASSSANGGFSGALRGAPPSPLLAGCVRRVTGTAMPTLVDRASYDGRSAYVIVARDKVWVVGLGCTAVKPELITSASLAGLSGNLRALVSVERLAAFERARFSDRRT